MRQTIHIAKPDETLSKIFNKTFPGYRGRTFEIRMLESNSFHFAGAFWSGGSKSTYVCIHLDTLETYHPGGLSDPAEFGGREYGDQRTAILPQNVAVVENSIFCGKNMGLTLHVPESNAIKFLPSTEEVSDNEKIVLVYTSRLKNSYAGRTNIRFSEASRRYGITSEDWESAKLELIQKGHLRKNGSITPNGRNVDTGDYR